MSAPAESANLVLSRERRGPRDLFRSYTVMIDGKEVARIKRGQRLELPITPGPHVIFLKIDWCHSPYVEIETAAGQAIQLTCVPGAPGFDAESYIQLQRS